jgi:hypothetical protein
MEIELRTPEQKQKSVSACYDSFNLITKLKAKQTLTEDETDILKRNEDHIRIMLGKEWFVEELTKAQKTELSKI